MVGTHKRFMMDKLELIRKEIEGLRGCASPLVICNTLLSFIDSINEDLKPKFKVGQTIIDPTDPTFSVHINKIEEGKYIEREDVWVLIHHADEEYRLVEEPELTHSVTKISDQGEPANEDLEKELDRYLPSVFNKDMDGGNPKFTTWFKVLRKTALHFANWQKQQMMKDAVDGEIKTIYHDAVKAESVGFSTQKTGMFEGDKVKLIVIKEERI